MGFGNRVYRTYDSRSRKFKTLAKELAEARPKPEWYETAEVLKQTVLREFVEKQYKPIYPNVDFYTGVVYKYLGIPPQLTTAVFTIGRI